MSRLTSAIVEALKDPVLGPRLADLAKSLIQARATSERVGWGLEPDSTELDEIGAPEDAVADLGVLYRVQYLAKKGRDPLALYDHRFNISRPWLVVTSSGDLAIARGESRYRVLGRGIVG